MSQDLFEDPAYRASLEVFRRDSDTFKDGFRQALRDQLDAPGQDFFVYRYLEPGNANLPALMTADPGMLDGNFWIGCGLSHDRQRRPEDWPTFMWGSVVYNDGDTPQSASRMYPWELVLDPRQTDTARDVEVLAAMCIAATRTWIVRNASKAHQP